MGRGQTPYSAIAAQANRLGIDGDDFEVFRSVMRALDGVYLEHMNSRDDDDKSDGKSKPKRKRGKASDEPHVSTRKMTPQLFQALFAGK